jgi:hypothetical protein
LPTPPRHRLALAIPRWQQKLTLTNLPMLVGRPPGRPWCRGLADLWPTAVWGGFWTAVATTLSPRAPRSSGGPPQPAPAALARSQKPRSTCCLIAPPTPTCAPTRDTRASSNRASRRPSPRSAFARSPPNNPRHAWPRLFAHALNTTRNPYELCSSSISGSRRRECKSYPILSYPIHGPQPGVLAASQQPCSVHNLHRKAARRTARCAHCAAVACAAPKPQRAHGPHTAYRIDALVCNKLFWLPPHLTHAITVRLDPMITDTLRYTAMD